MTSSCRAELRCSKTAHGHVSRMNAVSTALPSVCPLLPPGCREPALYLLRLIWPLQPPNARGRRDTCTCDVKYKIGPADPRPTPGHSQHTITHTHALAPGQALGGAAPAVLCRPSGRLMHMNVGTSSVTIPDESRSRSSDEVPPEMGIWKKEGLMCDGVDRRSYSCWRKDQRQC